MLDFAQEGKKIYTVWETTLSPPVKIIQKTSQCNSNKWLGLELEWQQRGKESRFNRELILKMNQCHFSVKFYVNTHYVVCRTVDVNSLALPGIDNEKDNAVKKNSV